MSDELALAPAEVLASGPRLLDRLSFEARRRRLSARTEDAYRAWVRRFVLFHGRRHPRELGAAEIAEFLSHLATAANVAASTQNQALAALLFLYRDVLGLDPGPLLPPPAPAARSGCRSSCRVRRCAGCSIRSPVTRGWWYASSTARASGCSRRCACG